MAQSKESFFADLIDDYYAECDEHLATIRRALLAIEPALHQRQADRRPLDDLFRSFHTIKGLSGMVGLREAEDLAHNVETFLRALLKGLAPLSPEGMDALLASAKMLEEVIAAHRMKKPMPDLKPVMTKLLECSSGIAPTDESVGSAAHRVSEQMLDAARMERLKEALGRGAKLWRFEFTPDPSLAKRGVTVNLIRSRLLEMGEIINAFPEVTPGEGIKFAFIVASFQAESSFVAFMEDGVAYEPYLPPEEIAEESGKPAEASLDAPLAHEAGREGARATERPTRPITPAHVIRVDLARLDQLIETLTSLVISKAHLEHNLQRVEPLIPSLYWRPLQEAGAAMAQRLRELREGLMGLRMLPVRDVFERMRFAVYDLCREQRKRVVVETRGEETEIDKYVVERMIDPLLHIVRNAVSHGIEPEEERMAHGKAPEGLLKLSASTSGDFIVIEVEDDGKGIDAELVLRKAESDGLIAKAEDVGRYALLDILCEVGFTTLSKADVTSGRGVGMSVVGMAVQELGGALSLDTRKGQGTRFTIRLPLTLAIMDALIVSIGGRTFAMPVNAAREIIEVDPAEVTLFERNEIIRYREGVLPLIRLTRLLKLKEERVRVFYAIVVGTDASASGLAVDRLLGQREIVVRTLVDPLIQTPGVSGATELGDGRAVLILDPAALVQLGRRA